MSDEPSPKPGTAGERDDSHSKQAQSSRRTIRVPATDDRFEVPLRGVEVGAETRCTHYDGSRDIIAIRFPCCGVFYPCYACHEESADHPAERWQSDQFETPAVRCGACSTVLTVEQYLDAGSICPACGAAFNPECERHHDRYFRVG